MKEIVSKRQQVINAVEAKDYKKALKIAKSFTIDFDKEEQRIIQIAYETLCGRDSMFKMLKINTTKMVEDAKKLVDNFGARDSRKTKEASKKK